MQVTIEFKKMSLQLESVIAGHIISRAARHRMEYTDTTVKYREKFFRYDVRRKIILVANTSQQKMALRGIFSEFSQYFDVYDVYGEVDYLTPPKPARRLR